MSPSVEEPGATANSGIRKLSNGASVIPSSKRADGSVRKEIRVKPGYRPPEDVEVYKNRTAEAWKNRGKGGVPGAEAAEDNQPPHKAAAAAAKNAKRREARKKASTASGAEQGEDEETAIDVGKGADGEAGLAKLEEQPAVDPDAEKGKEARKLAKKLRQARDLQEKKDNGDGLLPEQLAKVIKINELIRQLDNLGFDQTGEEKVNQKEAVD